VKLSVVNAAWHKSQQPVNQSCGPLDALYSEVEERQETGVANLSKPESNGLSSMV
jgi:hypothetical protein